MSDPKTGQDDPRTSNDKYDKGIVPAETGARREREGENYRQTPEGEASLDTTGGYTMDREGLMNNYATEPEMYYDTPGDAKEQEKQEKLAEAAKLQDTSDNDEKGLLTDEVDLRGKGSGAI